MELSASLLGVFFAAVIEGDTKLVLTEWDSRKSDLAERDKLRAAIKAASPERWKQTPKAPDDLLWVLERADALSDVRNDAMHAVVALEIGAVAMSVAFASQGEREKKLRDWLASLIDEFKKCAENIDELGVFVAEAFHVFNQPDGVQWPSRPKHIWAAPKRG